MASNGEGPDPNFPCSVELNVPFPTNRLATISMRATGVDKEISPLVSRTMEVVPRDGDRQTPESEWTVLRVRYKATTNRMLRVALNSFLETLVFNIEVMENMDQDVMEAGLGRT